MPMICKPAAGKETEEPEEIVTDPSIIFASPQRAIASGIFLLMPVQLRNLCAM